MIDNIRFKILNKSLFENYVSNNSVIDLETSFNPFTGEVKDYPKKGKLDNLEVRITEQGASVYGSLHKFENISFGLGNQNHNDFTFESLSYLIPYLIEKFSIQGGTSLTNLEMGFNVRLTKEPQLILDNNLLMYDLKNHNKDLKFQGKGDFKEFIKSDYSLKIYNKSKQYKLKDNILRIELKIIKKRLLHNLGIYKLEDLLDKDILFDVFRFLWKELDKILLIDDVDSFEIPIKDLERLNKYTNPNFWVRIRKDKSLKILRTLEKDFKMLIARYDLGKTKTELKDKLLLKFWYSMNNNCKETFLEKSA